MSKDGTEQVHNPDVECWTNKCHDDWTVVMEKTEIGLRFGYCEEHAEMWERIGHNFERVRTVETEGRTMNSGYDVRQKTSPTHRMCEQCGGVSDTLFLSPRGSICKHCVNDPERGPDDLKTEYPDLWDRYKE